MKHNKDSLHNDYFRHLEKYEKIYGKDRTVICMQIGNFFQILGIDNETEKIGMVPKLAELLNIVQTRADKRIIENNRKNPQMCGVNIAAFDKYLKILVDNNYTVVQIEETVPPDKLKRLSAKREVTNIISKGTNIDILKSDSNNIMSIYVEETKYFKTNKYLLSIGISVIDISTGKNILYEIYDKPNDQNYALDEALRFILSYGPKEILLNYKLINQKIDNIKLKLGLSDDITFTNTFDDNKFRQISYQNIFFESIFKDNNNSSLSYLEFLNIENYPLCSLSYVMLLKYAYEHNHRAIEKIKLPTICKNNKYLILDNNTIQQLNIVNSDKQFNNNSKYNSLFDIVNNTSTSMGKRYLRELIVSPIIGEAELNERYDCVGNMITSGYHEYEDILKNIKDIERFQRKLALGILHPHEFYVLHESYINIVKLYKKINNEDKLKKLIPNDIDCLSECIDEYTKIFNFDIMCRFDINNITQSFLVDNIDERIDDINRKIKDNFDTFNQINTKLTDIIRKNEDIDKKLVYYDNLPTEGYFFVITKVRLLTLKKKFKNPITVIHKGKKVNINLSDLKIKEKSKTSCQIKSELISSISSELVILRETMKMVARESYINILNNLYKKYNNLFFNLVSFVQNVDIYKSHAKTAILNKYVRPSIEIKDEHSYIIAKDVRHPIIEKILDDVEYVPNDINLDSKNNSLGKLIYGINGIGKSLYTKSVGLLIILAQIGSYVPASSLTYSPYELILTRILGNDNMFKGHSSYAIEMIELRNILKRANCKSLVLGDEICRGTETYSALSIVASTLISLCEKQSNFVFATHLHKLSEIEQLRELDEIKIYHMKVESDKNKHIVYNRKLEDGPGKSTYGIEVAEYMELDGDFIERAYEIRNEIIKNKNIVIPEKTSKYNKEVFVMKCEICDKQEKEDQYLETHHISFQCNADENGFIKDKHFHKNKKHNLVILCKKHHIEVHHGSLIIHGWIDTSKGKILKYEYVKKSSKKYNDEQIKKILKFKGNETQVNACKLLDKDGINVSKTTLSKIWKGKY